MSTTRWFSCSALALALLGAACRTESERAEGAVREPGAEPGGKGAAPAGQERSFGQEAREQADKAREQAEKARAQADKAGGQAEQAREQAERAIGQEAREQADRAREQADKAREQADKAGGQAEQARGQADRAIGQAERGGQAGAARPQGGGAREAQGAREQTAPPAGGRDQAAPQGGGRQEQAGGANDKAQPADAAAAARDAWTRAAKENDYQVTFGRDGSVIATKESPKPGKRLPDDALRNTVAGKLADSDHEPVKKLNVSVRDGVVTLQGNVPSVKEAIEAMKAAMSADGVTKVISTVRYEK
ncbi:BON domain-containing protein [Sorangium sp. So ce131]|uniref:BON domain-containing protein n=1 Tax=Sorangium sp. So ce131 TaxID=3133282 RepID=UPI003F6405CB